MVDRLTLDFENETVEWVGDDHNEMIVIPSLHLRKFAILAELGHGNWELQTNQAAVLIDTLLNSKISPSEVREHLQAEFDKKKYSFYLPSVRVDNVFFSALETYSRVGGKDYARYKAIGFVRKCGAGTPEEIYKRIDISAVLTAAYRTLDKDTEKAFWVQLRNRLSGHRKGGEGEGNTVTKK